MIVTLINSKLTARNLNTKPLHNLPKFVPGYFMAEARWMSFLDGANVSV